MAGGRFELAMEPTAIGLGSLKSNSETHMTAICDARPIYGRGWISRVFICCAALTCFCECESLFCCQDYEGEAHVLVMGLFGL